MSKGARTLLIAITGADGSGKSTACAALAARLAGEPGLQGRVAEVSVWDAMGSTGAAATFKTKAEAEAYLGELDGRSRTLFIYHALSRALQLGLAGDPAIVLLNGYWFKYAVSELGYGVEPELVLGAARGFPRPDLTLCLDIDPETAWARRQKATGYEQGGARGAGGKAGTLDTTMIAEALSAQSRFIGFQQGLRRHWRQIEEQAAQKAPWTHVSALLPPAEVVDTLVREVRKLRADPGGA